MSLLVYPSGLAGETFPIVKRPIFSTIVQRASSSLEVRVGNYIFPIMEWDIPYSWLSQEEVTKDFQTLFGFFLKHYGQFAAFHYIDPNDYFTRNPTNQDIQGEITIGVGDGVTTDFPCLNVFNGGYERIEPNAITSVSPPAYTLLDGGVLRWASPPSFGTPIKINCTFYFRVRFAEDENEFTNMVTNWWELKKVTLRQVKAITA